MTVLELKRVLELYPNDLDVLGFYDSAPRSDNLAVAYINWEKARAPFITIGSLDELESEYELETFIHGLAYLARPK